MTSIDATSTVVVDGGGSGSRYALYDRDGAPKAWTTSGPASLSLGERAAWSSIESALVDLAQACPELQIPNQKWLPDRLVMGLAGSLQQERRDNFLALCPDNISVLLVTDGYAQLIGATAGQPGICLAAGTGTVVHWLDSDGSTDMVGGWGFPFGDEGSGAWLGAQLLKDYLWFRDGAPVRPGAEAVFDALVKITGSSVSDLQRWSTCSSSTQMASLVPLIQRTSALGNAYSMDLIQQGSEYCSRLLDLAPADLPIFLCGGLSTLYKSDLQRRFGNRVSQASGDALSGLYRLSLEHQW